VSTAVESHVVATRLRLGALALAALGIVGTGSELAFLRHWNGFEQLIPWAVLGVLAVAALALAVHPGAAVVRTVRAMGVTALAAGGYGVYVHVSENYATAPLDGSYGPRWDSMNVVERVWAAATGSVGPAPTLAPAALTQIGLCLLLACVAHPALSTVRARRGGLTSVPAPR
jgi:hypothetical protein